MHAPEHRRKRYVAADPYPWPYNGDLRPQNTALIVIDMQTDFCGVGGYVDKMGYDLSLTRAPIEPIKRTLAAAARQGLPHHPHPRGPSPRSRRSAGQQALALASDRCRHRRSGPVRPHPGARRAGLGDHRRARAAAGELIIDKPGKGSFCATDLELMLRLARHRQYRAHRHHHRCLRPHHHARGQRSRLRMPAAGGLLRRHRQGQSRRRHQDDQDAGRRVRRGVGLGEISSRPSHERDGDAHSARRPAVADASKKRSASKRSTSSNVSASSPRSMRCR